MKLRRKLPSLEANLQQLDGQVTLECRHKEKYLNSPVKKNLAHTNRGYLRERGSRDVFKNNCMLPTPLWF